MGNTFVQDSFKTLHGKTTYFFHTKNFSNQICTNSSVFLSYPLSSEKIAFSLYNELRINSIGESKIVPRSNNKNAISRETTWSQITMSVLFNLDLYIKWVAKMVLKIIKRYVCKIYERLLFYNNSYDDNWIWISG